MELILNLKKVLCLRFLNKKSVLKLLDRTVYTPMEIILNKKRYGSSSCVFDF